MELIKDLVAVKISLGVESTEFEADNIIGQLVYSKLEEFRVTFVHIEMITYCIGNEYLMVANKRTIRVNLEEVLHHVKILYGYVFGVVHHVNTITDQDKKQDFLEDKLKCSAFALDLQNLKIREVEEIKLGLEQAKVWIDKLEVFTKGLK
ncbi:hypothetical protein Liucustia_151 [Acinetobacter phage Liucustia]|nr:hypothetical protein Liucustia_151 [Acinetobacter phage Liucustia]